MTGVVLRCPNCGTTRTAPGECEACHEAQTRYYCTNHTPGVWLESTACSQCGAQFGDAARMPKARAPDTPERSSARPRQAVPIAPRDAPSAPASRPPPRYASAERPRGGIDPARPPLLFPATEAAPDFKAALPWQGCFLRFVLIVVFLFLALISGLFVFGGSLLQMLLR